jgi:DNA-binding protein Fis
MEMGVERASATDVSSQELGKSLPVANSALRIAQRPERDRIKRLVELTHSLLSEMETLVSDRAFVEQSNKLESVDLASGIDFYTEVEKFEVGLIKLALKHTHGNQARASQLLRLKPTTLNCKIKSYGIEY